MTRSRGFTLLEILVAMALLAMMAGVLMGSLSLTGRSLEGGEQKAEATAGMRLAHDFLRSQLESQYPIRWRKIADTPLLFVGERDAMQFAAAVPQRIAGSGIWYYRLAVGRNADRSPLVLERVVPELGALEATEFRDADRSILADDVEELRISYLGRDPLVAETIAPTWRDRWDDRQRLPQMIRIDVRPRGQASWPSLYVAPRMSLDAGCRAWDAGQNKCLGV
jgi:general secretion pathway protein J